MSVSTVILENRGMLECPRWHDGKLWFADWTSSEILSLDDSGVVKVATTAKAPPLSFDFCPLGDMYVVAAGASHLLQLRGSELSDFAPYGSAGGYNEIVIDAIGRIYVNGPAILLIDPDGSVEKQAEGFEFPNGMAISADRRTLVCAESWARRLTAFDMGDDGRLSNRRIWADLPGPPDGICFDADDAIWYCDVPNACCRRVREGGEVLDEVKLDRGAFACMLGGVDRRVLYITAAKWFGMEKMDQMGGTGQIQSVKVKMPGAGWPFG